MDLLYGGGGGLIESVPLPKWGDVQDGLFLYKALSSSQYIRSTVGWRENRSTLVRYLTIEFRVYLDGTDVGVVTLVVVDSRD